MSTVYSYRSAMFPFVLVLTAAVLLGSSHARVDPECNMNPQQIAKRYGYKLENHYVTTDDGYILEVHRIPNPNNPNAPVVFLQHGLLDSSVTWMIMMKTGSFAFVLADAGYDVWMGNVRGNTYGKNHTTLPVKSDAFWDFTFDEMAAIDLPNMVDYALKVSGQKELFYYGHSQGTIIAFTGFTQNKELASKIKLFTALAPVGHVAHIKGFFRVLSIFEPQVQWILQELGVREFLPSNWLIREVATILCPESPAICSDIIFLLAGWDTSNFNESRISIIESHTPAGTSVKNIIHWSQMIHSQQLQKFDYGSGTENMKHYGQPTPPIYDISGLSLPTVFVTGGNDWLGDPRDMEWLYKEVGHTIVKDIGIDYYNHLDFLWGEDAPQKVYYPMIEFMKNM